MTKAANDDSQTSSETGESLAFSFGGVERAGSFGGEYSDLHYNDMDDYWEPPLDTLFLAQLANQQAHHGSLINARAGYIAARFQGGGGGITSEEIRALARDYIQFGHLGAQIIFNRMRQPMMLGHLPAMYLRRKKNRDFVLLERDDKKISISQSAIAFVKQYDPQQQIYGLPDYLGGVQSALLNVDATLFRRKYYLNGAHMGYIFYATDPSLSKEDEDELKSKIQSSKGIGNFRSLFINIPNGKEKGIQLIPVGDIATKDDFERIKNITAQDVLVAHRFPGGKAGIIPQGNATFGDPTKVGLEYARDEIIPACKLIMEGINKQVPPRLHVKFDLTLPTAA
ncbi:phage portal protein [Enterovibrio norvegicus]|uniref:phage portal protein n=1 Tax=Enterovibrio norvegicus TaxID=188144 RepID=UPI001F539A80|nr:phage portal protein [Enterovibrio norvegicus]